ncbi:MAG: gamma-glutamyl-gamma-aminobutyrate hydrolase family protein [Bacteroidales bacterium]
MKKKSLRAVRLVAAVFLLLSGAGASAQDTLLVLHPTKYNLRMMNHLIENGIFPLEEIHLLGIYHTDEAYDYEEAEEYIRKNRLAHVSLVEVKGTLDTDNTYRINPCSPRFRELFTLSRGAFFLGGPDIPPALYDEPVHLLTRVTDPFRHYFEVSFLYHLLGGDRDPDWKPLLDSREDYLVCGICLGMQTMNVATGGTLIQDIPTEIYRCWTAEAILALPSPHQHRNYADLLHNGGAAPTSYHFHPIRVAEGSFLDNRNGSPGEPLVLSSHHQAVETPGKGWRIAATSLDGKVIEAIEHTQYPRVFGVQFHPEKPGLFDPEILHLDVSGDSVSFLQTVRGTDSFTFHVNFWRSLADRVTRSR